MELPISNFISFCRERRVKTVQWHANGTIAYKMARTFHFDQLQSGNLSDDDMITTINFPYVVSMMVKCSLILKLSLLM